MFGLPPCQHQQSLGSAGHQCAAQRSLAEDCMVTLLQCCSCQGFAALCLTKRQWKVSALFSLALQTTVTEDSLAWQGKCACVVLHCGFASVPVASLGQEDQLPHMPGSHQGDRRSICGQWEGGVTRGGRALLQQCGPGSCYPCGRLIQH